MAHKLTIIKVTKSTASTTHLEVPAEDAAELQDAFDTMTANPDTEGVLEFDTADKRKAYIRVAKVWAATHSPVLNFRQLPQAGNPDTILRFSIKVRPTDEQRAAAKKARAEKQAEKDAAKLVATQTA